MLKSSYFPPFSLKISMLELIRKNSNFFIPYFCILAAAFLLEAFFSNADLTFWINSKHSDSADPLFEFFTWIGTGNVWICLIFLTLFILFTKSYQKGVFFLVVFNVAGLLGQIIKKVFYASLPRPVEFFAHHHPGLHFVKGFLLYHWQTFPSGHTVTAFSMAVLLTAFASNKAMGYFYLAMAICIGWSRIYLGEHFFLDVVSGSILGSLTSLCALYLATRQGWLERPWFKKTARES